MESDIQEVLLWLYQENLWLYMIYTRQKVIIFSAGVG